MILILFHRLQFHSNLDRLEFKDFTYSVYKFIVFDSNLDRLEFKVVYNYLSVKLLCDSNLDRLEFKVGQEVNTELVKEIRI